MQHHIPLGFRFAGVSCGIKPSRKKDVSLIYSDTPAVAAGVYTRNVVVAAPVVSCRNRTPTETARLVVVNSGNANACTGAQGAKDAERMCQLAAACCGDDIDAEQTLVMSTGIIGQVLPMANVESGIQSAASQLNCSEQAFLDSADGILTTDIARKVSSRQCKIDGRNIRIAGMAKGAGMIGPNMATMLCCIVTDAPLSPTQAQQILTRVADRSFNNISVEGHTSTNDTMLLLANGCAGGGPLDGEAAADFELQLEQMCIELAKQIPSDGEGASHLIEVQIVGAASESDARKIAHSVASSNLVKTAICGADPNWGRIVSAAGYAEAEIDTDRLSLQLNGYDLFACGEPMDFDQAAASKSIRDNQMTTIQLRVGNGEGCNTHWTSDLTVDYVRFNSEYTT